MIKGLNEVWGALSEASGDLFCWPVISVFNQKLEGVLRLRRQQNNQRVLPMTDAGLNKRSEILLAAKRLIREKGYNGTSMQDIANQVGLLKGSLYYHFANKEELLCELLIGGISRLLTNCREILKETNLETRNKLKELIKQHVLHLTTNDHSVSIASSELNNLTGTHREVYLGLRNEYSRLWLSILEEGVQNGEFPSIDVELTSKAARGMINWLIEWYKPEGNFQPEYIADYFASLICDFMLGKVHVQSGK